MKASNMFEKLRLRIKRGQSSNPKPSPPGDENHGGAGSRTPPTPTSPVAVLAQTAMATVGAPEPNASHWPDRLLPNRDSVMSSNAQTDGTGTSHATSTRTSPLREDSLQNSNVPDLSGKIKVISPHAVFEGTYSSVFIGSYKGEKVAIKVVRGVKNADGMRRKIRREIETWWGFDHPNILPCYGFVTMKGFGEYGSMISPWCENGNALTYLSNSPSPDRRVEMFGDVARGLLYLHQFNPTIVHGDLKPANVLIDEYNRAKLCDFGLVRLIQEDGYATGTTTTTAHTGTARYLPRELIETDQLPNTASDVYSLACMGLEFIYLRPPYAHIQSHQANAHYKICRDITEGIPPALRPERLNYTMTEFWDLLEECWSIRADTRPSTEGIVLYLEHHSQDIVDSLHS